MYTAAPIAYLEYKDMKIGADNCMAISTMDCVITIAKIKENDPGATNFNIHEFRDYISLPQSSATSKGVLVVNCLNNFDAAIKAAKKFHGKNKIVFVTSQSIDEIKDMSSNAKFQINTDSDTILWQDITPFHEEKIAAYLKTRFDNEVNEQLVQCWRKLTARVPRKFETPQVSF